MAHGYLLKPRCPAFLLSISRSICTSKSEITYLGLGNAAPSQLFRNLQPNCHSSKYVYELFLVRHSKKGTTKRARIVIATRWVFFSVLLLIFFFSLAEHFMHLRFQKVFQNRYETDKCGRLSVIYTVPIWFFQVYAKS